ncbi:cell division suppressor protein YneA [Mesobacillus subterraneus]|uniref:LysM peptidoglycan-binding domain-containing protein n=1 Tax=Mesobacillus subterraneus TaxID=285983 RepID=A0A427TWN9_9BACI|nr:LysM peptidoglycan-binding domain-containing protein [Mesobacillus subterraneus]RSD28824.1 LysM peptidoglycan-binding domain-containing protein [Mesobacillus subterraneus]
MKKLWNNYSYAIVLLAVSLMFTLVAKVHLNTDDAYITVTIEEGQSLWELSESFGHKHNLSDREFISWVEKENGIIGERIYPGDEIVIPVIADHLEPTQIAGAEE